MKSPGLTGQGKMGGTVVQRNHYGTFTRLRVKPTNPNTPAQVAVRDLQRQGTRAWSNLSPDQRLGWNTWAATHPRLTRKGSIQALTGHAAFVSAYRTQSAAGLDVDDCTSAPSGAIPLAGQAPTTFVVEPNIDPIGLTVTPSATGAAGAYVIRMSAPLTPGQSTSKTGMKQIAVVTIPDSGPRPPEVDLGAAYASVWGSLPSVAGAHILTEIRGVDAGQVHSVAKTDSVARQII